MENLIGGILGLTIPATHHLHSPALPSYTNLASPTAQPHSLRPGALCADGGHGCWWVLPVDAMAVEIYNL